MLANKRPPERKFRRPFACALMLVAQRRKDLVPFDAKSLIHMVRLAGIEPTTPWFVAKYSIQLSYSRPGGILACCAQSQYEMVIEVNVHR